MKSRMLNVYALIAISGEARPIESGANHDRRLGLFGEGLGATHNGCLLFYLCRWSGGRGR